MALLRGTAKGLLFGTLAGLALFSLEGAGIRAAGAGLNMDLEGPYRALMAAVRPALPSLLLRVAVVYVVVGALGGALAGLLAAFWRPARFWPVLVTELLVMAVLLAWGGAVARPALFDDVPGALPLLSVLVESGRPWHVKVAWLVFAGAHVWPLTLRLREDPRRARAFAAMMVAAAGTGWATGMRSEPVNAAGPLFLLIGIDALRPDHLQVAPNLAAFVGEATEYTKAYTPIAQTEPAWRSLLTARWPHRAGSRYPLTAQQWWPAAPTVPQVLEQHGIATHFETDCSRFNYQDETSGFGVRRQPPRGALNFALEKLRFRFVGLVADNAVGAWWVPELVENRALAGIYEPFGYARRLAHRIIEAAQQGPTFYAFHATAAHFPGDPAYPFYRKYVSPTAPILRRLRMVFTPIASGASPTAGWTQSDSEALYDELIAQADTQLGILFSELKEAGLYDDAYVVVFSDHGESFHSDAPQLAGATPVHGARLTDEENRVVLAIKPGRLKGPKTVDTLVRLIDVGPTLLEAAGLPPLPEADGQAIHRLEGPMLYAETGFTHASPAAFDQRHLALAPRTFDAYRVRSDGVVEMTDAAHRAVLAEKDVGVFDGQNWLVRQPLSDGTVRETCRANCQAMANFLAQVQKETE